MDGFAQLAGQTVGFASDLIRNIPSIREAQDLFDDLIEDDEDREFAIVASSLGRMPTDNAIISRPFDYGTAVAYSFEAANWQESRFSDGRAHGVWYGSTELETTIYETVFHWHHFVMASFEGYGQEVVAERRCFQIFCDALLIDLRGKEAETPELVSRTSYAFCQRLGAYLVEQNQNGLITKSARCDGTNAAIFRQDRLSNVRDLCYLTYRMVPGTDFVTVERRPGQIIEHIQPSSMI